MFSAATKTDGASSAAVYVEDVFSTYVYTGNGSTQTIVNNLDLGGSTGSGMYYDGTGDVVTTTMPALGTGDFTIEFWFYPTNATRAYQLLDKAFRDSNFSLVTDYLNTGNFYLNVGGTSYTFFSTPPMENRWTHIAIVRGSGSISAYVNGVQALSPGANTGNVTTGTLYIGGGSSTGSGYQFMIGWMSNVRITNTAVYTSNYFTVPTSQLTAISGTQLLTLTGANPSIDYSPNAYTVTVTNAVPTTVFGPFPGPNSKGGLVWLKNRSGINNHALYDTLRGATYEIYSNLTDGQVTNPQGVYSFNNNGFTVSNGGGVNANGGFYTSWTFCQQPKFFDVVTYTGTGANRTVSHNLGSVPGCIIVKRLDTVGAWQVYHRSLANTEYMVLNTLGPKATGATRWNSTTPTDTVFSLGTDSSVNAVNSAYVAYIFAHDAGGFGLTGSDNVISCGSYVGTGNSSGLIVTLGYEPQWVLIKKATGTNADWVLTDNIRGSVAFTSTVGVLYANATDAELNGISGAIRPSATGFEVSSNNIRVNEVSSTYIYIAIRRGPMKVPTTGTSVFQPVVYTGTNVDNRLVNTTILADMILARQRNSTTITGMVVGDRLRANSYLVTGTTAGGNSDADSLMTPTLGYGNSFSAMNGFGVGNDATSQLNASTVASNQVVEAFQRAPGFFDVVAYTGSGALRTIAHNLQAVPQMMWIKSNAASVRNWAVYTSTFGPTGWLELNSQSQPQVAVNMFNNTAPTSSVFTVNINADVNDAGASYVAYLFGSVPGVSQVSYYVGKGSGNTNQVNCGFTSGARLIIIRSLLTNTSLWYVYDSARGIVSGNDPFFALNSNTAENTSTDYVDPYSPGFEITSTAPDDLNGSYADNWVIQSTVSGTNNIQDIMYANGFWVFGDAAARIGYSRDGYGYTLISGVLSAGSVFGVAFGNGLYIAVGTGGRISTSPDLTTWTARTSGTANALYGAAYAFGKYWAVGAAATVISSTDGITWSSVSTGATQICRRVRLLNGNLVIIGDNGTMITSADGTNFTVRNTGSATEDYNDVTFGNSLYVVIGDSGVIRTSPDLATWTSRSSGALSGNSIYGVTWTGSRFVAVATAGETGYSTDGITWSTGAAAGTFVNYCVAFGNDMIVAGNSDGDLNVSNPKFIFMAIA